MKFGKFEVHSIVTGQFALDGGAMFGVVPKVFWEKTNPADERNRIALSMRSLLIISDDRKILVDTGAGNKNNDKFNAIYGIQNSNGWFDEALNQCNLNTDDITDVILTHLHFDHCGGSTKKVNNEIIPTFANAKYYIQREHFEWAMNASDKDRASFLIDDFLPLKDHDQLILTEGEFKLFEGVEILASNGHTPKQQHVKLTSEERTIFYSGDMIPTASHIPFPYVMGYDLYPVTTIEEKKKILPQAYEENWILFFEHDPFVNSVTITSTEKGFAIKEKNLIND
ncbi:MAG: MBL fold metallo-hydrolase [Ignavibacteria bacterium]|nr:MBL fold metallo-hydrolase [Ignavibacteria bacterium]